MQHSNNLMIRPAKSADIEPMTAVCYRTIREKYPAIIGSEAVEAYIASGAVPAYFTEHLKRTRIAEVDGKQAGACTTLGHQIHLMMVDVSLHRGGIGSALLADGEQQLFAAHQRIGLESFRDNAQAVDFYRKHGWRAVDYFDMPDHGIPMVRMDKHRED